MVKTDWCYNYVSEYEKTVSRLDGFWNSRETVVLQKSLENKETLVQKSL